MAAITVSKYEKATGTYQYGDIVQYFGTSASASSDTLVAPPVASNTTRPKRLLSVTVKYSAAATVTVTVTKNYLGLGGGSGTTYDVLLNSQALGGGTDYVYQPTSEEIINGGDTITVSVPAVTAATAAIVVTYGVL